ncbi:MAG: PfkB family carbohydrate kinase, partial [Geminicoccaceae bacterium]
MLLVFGSINVDLLFKVAALARPGETVLCPSYELAAGGKGANQATAAARAGATVRMIGHVGDDSFGRFARQAMATAGVDGASVATSDKATGIAVIGIDRAAENQIMVASGANLDAHAEQIADPELAPGVTLLCQNEVRPEATFALLERAKARGARTILNLAPAGEVPPRVLDALDVLVVNRIEAQMAVGDAGHGDPAALARDLAGRHALTCVITLGAAGALAIGPQDGHRLAALPIEPVDTTGAGDAFAGVLAAALDQGHD